MFGIIDRAKCGYCFCDYSATFYAQQATLFGALWLCINQSFGGGSPLAKTNYAFGAILQVSLSVCCLLAVLGAYTF